MTITPRELLDTSIAQLRTLAAFLGDQLGESGDDSEVSAGTLEVCACKEVLVSLGALIPKLQATRNVISGESKFALYDDVSNRSGDWTTAL
jgi:hypothetical protein